MTKYIYILIALIFFALVGAMLYYFLGGGVVVTDTTTTPSSVEVQPSKKDLLDGLRSDAAPKTEAEKQEQLSLLDQLSQERTVQGANNTNDTQENISTTSTSTTNTTEDPNNTTEDQAAPADIDPSTGARTQADVERLKLLEQMNQ